MPDVNLVPILQSLLHELKSSLMSHWLLPHKLVTHILVTLSHSPDIHCVFWTQSEPIGNKLIDGPPPPPPEPGVPAETVDTENDEDELSKTAEVP